MAETFEKYIREKVHLTDAELQLIQSLAIKKKIRRHQFLLQEGDIARHKAYIISGLMKSYQIGDDGAEHILAFGAENWWLTDMESYNNNTPSKLNIDAIEDTEVLLWTKDNFNRLLKEIPAWEQFRDNLLARSFDAKERRILANISFTAEEKYRNFIEVYPLIYNRVPLRMIASFLGISRETLSRVRNSYVHHT